MEGKLQHWLKEHFSRVVDVYNEVRGEPLSEIDSLIMKVKVDLVGEVLDKKELQIHIWDALHMASAIESGFKPGEHWLSMLNLISKHASSLGWPVGELLLGQPKNAPALRVLESLQSWLAIGDRLDELAQSMDSDSEFAFWEGCFYKSMGEWEKAKSFFVAALEGSLDRRMKFMALQNAAWCSVRLGEWDDALAAYRELEEFAKMPKTQKDAAECAGYIRAFRDFDVKPEVELLIRQNPEEFQEFDVVAEAEKIAVAKAALVEVDDAALQKQLSAPNFQDVVRGRLSAELGDVWEQLPGLVKKNLLGGELHYFIKGDFDQSIVRFYEAVECCIQWYVGQKLTQYADKNKVAKLGIRDWAILLEYFDKPIPKQNNRAKHKAEELCRELWQPFRNVARQCSLKSHLIAVGSLSQDLHDIQDLVRDYRHQGRQVILGPKSRSQKTRELDQMRRLVLQSGRYGSVIQRIVRLFESDKR